MIYSFRFKKDGHLVMDKDTLFLGSFFGAVGAVAAAFLTHVYWIIHILMSAGNAIPAGKVILALFGIFLPPFGVMHGVYLWFNVW